MNSTNISMDYYPFARGGPRASATSTHRPLPRPETKARRRSRRQGRRRVELGSNAACCPCSFPIVRSGAGPRQLTCLFNHLVGADGSVVDTAEQLSLPLLAPRSHRRRYTIPTDPPRAALQRSIGLFGGQDEDLCSRLEIGLVARHVGDNGRIGGNKDFLFPVLVLQRQRRAVNGRDDLLNVRIGHRALRSKVPWVMSFAGSPHRFGKDVHFECGLAAVGP